jgi:hypothetical protein
MLIMVAIFTANTSANLTASRLSSRITGVQDLPGKRVGTWDVSPAPRPPPPPMPETPRLAPLSLNCYLPVSVLPSSKSTCLP